MKQTGTGSTGTGSRSSPKTVISIPLDMEDSQETTSIHMPAESIPTMPSAQAVSAVASGPSKSTSNMCKGKCSNKNPCTHVGKSAALPRNTQITSTHGAALNILDIDLMNDLMDDGKFPIVSLVLKQLETHHIKNFT